MVASEQTQRWSNRIVLTLVSLETIKEYLRQIWKIEGWSYFLNNTKFVGNNIRNLKYVQFSELHNFKFTKWNMDYLLKLDALYRAANNKP